MNNTEGLILDLRNNPGGLLEEAIKVSDLFLEWKKQIVSTTSSLKSTTHFSKKLFTNDYYLNIPIVVLINHGSASAAEIVAAALQQNDRAVVIGQPSFGKGTVQTVWDLEHGYGLKLTVGEYLTPSGNSIHRIGVVPNIHLNPVYIPIKKVDFKKLKKSYKTYEKQNLLEHQKSNNLERFRIISGFEYEQKINSGKLYQLAEVVKDLNKKTDVIAEQSYSERQLFEKAYERLKSEFEVVLGDKAKLKMDKALKRTEDPAELEAPKV